MDIKRLFGKEMVGLWTRDLVVTTLAVFMMRFGEGLLGGARMNFFVDTLGITGGQVLLLEGIREVPGLILMFIAALTMRLPLSWRAAGSALVLGLGYMCYALIHSYTGLMVVAIIASFGLHGYQPIGPAMGLALATENTRGRVLGVLASVGSLAGIVGMGALAITSGLISNLPLQWFYVIGGAVITVSAFIFMQLSRNLGETKGVQPRLVLKKRYWRFYVLKLFEGSRKEILGSFCTLVLIERFGWQVWQISTLMLIRAVASLILAPSLGALVDHIGPRKSLLISYSVLALACIAYATVPVAMILAVLYIIIRLGQTLNLGLNVWIHGQAPSEELTPTLSAGVSVNHITSVAMPMLFGVLIPIMGYGGVYLLSAGIILVSIYFVVTMSDSTHRRTAEPQPVHT